MNTKSHAARVAQWIPIINACDSRDAGVTKKEWCEQHNIKLKSLEYWQRTVRNEALEKASEVTTDNAGAGGCFDITDQLLQAPTALSVLTSAQQDVPITQPFSPATSELVIQADIYLVYVNETVREKTLRTVLRALKDA